MKSRAVIDRIITIPNLVSFTRIGLVPVFWWVLLGLDDVRAAAALMIVIGTTDWVDGFLARKLNQVSRLGAVLDPVADRLIIASAVVGGLIAGVIPDVIGWPLIARELVVGIITLVVVSRGAGMLTVRYLGKLATFALYWAIPSFYLAAAGFLPWLSTSIAWLTGIVGLVAYWLVAFLYIGDARRAIANVESEQTDMES